MVQGGHVLQGTVAASGAKNAILPLLAATIMLKGETTLTNIPPIGDVNSMLRMLNALNVRAEYGFKQNVTVSNTKKVRHIAPYELVTAMRASFFVAGPLLARTGFAKVPLPGGCSIGLRPVDIHIKGLQALGASVRYEHGFVEFSAKTLKGAIVELPFPSVGATQNVMMAACLAEGKTRLNNAAREPEIVDLARFLKAAGAQITGAGTPVIDITGVPSLKGVSAYAVMSDRIEIGTLLIAGIITGGTITVTNADVADQQALLDVLATMGVCITHTDTSITCSLKGPLRPVNVTTQPHPGFPTDMQAQIMALLCTVKGTSLIKETIFENRFMHAHELNRMGAQITIDRQDAVICGCALSGAEVKMTDLRAGAAVVLAALAAKGTSSIYGLTHLQRGYYNLTGKLNQLGATINL